MINAFFIPPLAPLGEGEIRKEREMKRVEFLNLLLVMAVLIVAMVWDATAGAGMSLAVYSIFSYTSYGKVDLLNERLRRQQFNKSKFAMFVAPNFVKAIGEKGENVNTLAMDDMPKFTGAPVEMFEEFVKMGQVDMRIPVAQRLTGDPVFGDQPVEGTEERQTIMWRTVSINRTRKGVRPMTGMSVQLMKKLADQAALKAEGQLRTWLNDYWPGNFLLATLAGSSLDLIAPTANGGRAVSTISHPNFFVAGYGQVGYSGGRPGTAAYEAEIETRVNGLDDEATEGFTVDFILNIVQEAPRKKIAPILFKDGFAFYPIFATDSQWRQLQRDPQFKDQYKRANFPKSLAESPLSNGAEAYIGGAAIYPDVKGWGLRTNASDALVTAGTIEYGPAPTAAQRAAGRKVGSYINALDTNDRKIAILLGASALSIGVGDRPKMLDDDKDYGNIKGVAVDFIESVVRNDIFDKDGQSGLTAGDFQENTSSLIMATYSPQALTY